VIHYYWLVKSAVYRPLAYGAIVAILLLWRAFEAFRRHGPAIPAAAANTRGASANP
jgi:DMSO/TMAO reductase YedYZ heme-binding membrane subunit